ncbi:uncharacterized protein MYCFIDRAFT_84294 [Pseudocercospora fijiensis CIRAD86]|uniref:ubiquitinyl hydrolase 1 n=1 Tax=Pseudocercospora fijiensis (strain CIRAD86) TaxID=383855 RepID=M3AJL3_PSEFD|nr:uncharacterized protein MYCFIDRAFT_84294 [Pseudocercospora fijiensis CIRAD86]EME77662.1 hypothetical protein MYCFIDRAFT_84294 [Pseudocercospora fijiensis CIRAD86]
MAAPIDEHIQRIIDHVFLPPKLPQKEDDSSDIPLIRATVDALTTLRDTVLPNAHTMAMKISRQNAGVLITKKEDELIFEVFELSPRNEDVIATKGRLIRTFPANAVAVNCSLLDQTDFPSMIAHTLSTMCHQTVREMQPRSKKAQKSHEEDRDTNSPAMISELFLSVLRGIGESYPAYSIMKKAREEVLFDNAKVPWRRSPMWLLIRVTLQLVLTRSAGGSHKLYKLVMLSIMGHILRAAKATPVDMLYIMNAKIERRLQKLSQVPLDLVGRAIIEDVSSIVRGSARAITQTWDRQQTLNARDLNLAALTTLNFDTDDVTGIPKLEKYLQHLKARQHSTGPSNFVPSSGLIKFAHDDFPHLPTSNASDSYYASACLQSFEQWVARHLQHFMDGYERPDACEKLDELLSRYHGLSCAYYAADNPEAKSNMILVIFELWVACDKAAVRICPLLTKYDPGIPVQVLQSLILPDLEQMARMSDVEAYINDRSRSSMRPSRSLFDTRDAQGFAAQYYDQSDMHKSLFSVIEAEAEKARRRKKEEYRSTMSEYRRLDALCSRTEHYNETRIVDSWCDPPETEEVHVTNKCDKCRYENERNSLAIGVHEWPLPANPVESKAVVFELKAPSWLSFWRSCRFFLLQDVLKGTHPKATLRAEYRLNSNDPHLTSKYFLQPGSRKIGLLSESKPMCVTHYRSKAIAGLRESDLCVNNGLQYQYYDNSNDGYIGPLVFRDEVARACTYSLPHPALQKYIFRTASNPDGVGPNTVIASQDTCPESMTLAEFTELTTMPLGHHIQWANIVLQLAMPGVDFKKVETSLVILQCIYQAGPPGVVRSVLRESHAIFNDDDKALFILEQLSLAIQRVKENWESAQALSTFVAIAARILSLNKNARSASLKCLETARHITASWLQSLCDKAHLATDHVDRTAFANKAVEVALVCALTYDVGDKVLEGILKSSSNASILVQASIVIHEGEHCQSALEGARLARLALRFKRLLFRSYGFLAKNAAGMDDAVKKSWSGYVPGAGGWNIVSNKVDDWITTDTARTQGATMRVHYNLLTGQLLVNGLPLDQPPKQYRDRPLFSIIFGKALVEVMPASAAGFQFSTKRAFEGYEVQLGMGTLPNAAHEELIVQAKRGDTTFETLPKEILQETFPSSFVEDYVHWYHSESDVLEFRPAQDPWNANSTALWTLRRSKDRSGWRLTKDGSSLLGLGSRTSKMVGQILSPLADSSDIHIVLPPSERLIHVEMPHLRHGFVLHQGSSSLQSIEFRSMEVDQDQCLGTLIGFKNKVVLRSNDGKRRVLLLHSPTVAYSKHYAHVSVTASKKTAAKVHSLEINDLGRLLDNGELMCKLYVAYLHALTSFCLPDPLTRKTGTEQALSILESAAVRSFDQLTEENLDLLGKIASLSPGRCYYPAHERVMQTVDWDSNLSFLSQHGRLETDVRKILTQAEKSQFLFPGASLESPLLPNVDQHLQQRDSIKSSVFRTSGFGAEDHTTAHDKPYKARDLGWRSQRSTNSALMAGLVMRSSSHVHWEPQTAGQLWQLVCNYSQIHGYELPINRNKLRYDATVLEEGHEFAITRLPALVRWMSITQQVQQNHFSIMMWLSTMAFSQDAKVPVLQVIAMLPKLSVAFRDSTSRIDSFTPEDGVVCDKAVLKVIVDHNRLPYHSYPEYNITRLWNERQNVYAARRNNACQVAADAASTRIVDALFNQWRAETVVEPSLDVSRYVDVGKVIAAVGRKFKVWHDNGLLQSELIRIDQTIAGCKLQPVQLPGLTTQSPQPHAALPGYTSEADLFSGAPPQLPENCRVLVLSASQTQTPGPAKPTLLSSLVMRLETSAGQSKYGKDYVADLKDSLNALLSRDAEQLAIMDLDARALSRHLDDCKAHAKKLYDLLVASVAPASISSNVPTDHQWPRVSPLLFLRQLSRNRWSDLSPGWKSCIVKYGIALTEVQRAERLVQLSNPWRAEELANELRNTGHENWSAMDYPESLLIEVESGIMIREVQEEIAGHMRRPSTNNNSVMQLNMGEGKSSVIVPIVAAALADGDQLVRVIVAKPQSKQMAQMLVSKFGGLVDRRVYHLPFSRCLKLDRAAADAVGSILKECKSNSGVLLVQPEHILSLQLMAPECYITGKESVGQSLMETQDFLDEYSRDIVDESDENFSVRFELIYTMGLQRSIELSPHRWLLLQQLLDLVRQFAPILAQEFPLSLEVAPSVAGSFPRVRILRPDAEAALVHAVAQRICDLGLSGFQISRQPDEVRRAVYTYITKFDLSRDEVKAVENGVFWTETTKSHLLLLRGIIAGGVLAFTLGQKRWRVNYGPASRQPPTKLAVPYRAKDSPSPRSEFSHPDVVITLTSLCYYYDGLSDDDLFVALGHLMDSDQADIEYQAWVKDSDGLPAAFKQLQGINLKDRPQCVCELFPALRYGKNVVDYFLSHHVFPKEMKEFPNKLSASGWDIGKKKNRVTTGFSGTNDSRPLLPFDVGHLNLEQQKHTNALVLNNILQPENSVQLMARAGQDSSDAANLLATVSQLDPPVEVILDVGAQIVELDNQEVAATWLRKYNTTKEAAVFVNDSDELCVVDRHGRIDLLQTSSFATRLDLCLVFLDEAHTRGIDLKLPSTYRAALTLGANLTKDRLVQAAMRMRKLAKGQTLVFAISEEIQAKILECTSKSEPSDITVEDVLFWSMKETHVEVRRNMPLWAVQGERFVRQEKIWKAVRRNGKTDLTKTHAEKFLEEEAQTLDDRYRPRQSSDQPIHLSDSTDLSLQRIADRCREFNDLQFNSSTLQEEQERELSPEIEAERQVQRAPPAKPAPHSLHPDVRSFATTGQFARGSDAYMPAFEAMSDSSAAQGLGFALSQLAGGRHLMATADFARTVDKSGNSYISDAFQRPVQWLLTSCSKGSSNVDRILVVSPYEANWLFPHMKNTKSTTLHVYKPRCHSGYRPLDELDFCTFSAQSAPPVVPRALAVQLNLFAGQLYISTYDDYMETCKFLGLSSKALTQEMGQQGWQVDANGFIERDEQGRVGGESGLTKSPVNFFKILMSKIRRSGENISKTQMGSLLDGKLFEESDFDE